ncbi:MAG TPA: bacillithiol biosynthesis cysteine-adding enzyme BshC, partial [Chryseosolibacter sp.]|nr:bacillithiol biosynthesis cysteine-adding enzyme BshC [Chryseosolibacter sp.]
NIFTGPLYFIYKIVTVINTCKELGRRHPHFKFVPVYWMASEDHDYEEIKYFRLYGKKYVWETSQKGAVGRFETRGLDALLNTIPGDTQIFRDAYLKHSKLADSVRHYVNALFGSEGVIVIDPDHRELKAMFSHVMKEDVTENTTVRILEKTDKRLKESGYDPQIFCRDINFFFLGDQQRNRIEKQGACYTVVDTGQTFHEDQVLQMIASEPEKFSPNVVLRPLYQEVILPNIAYVGGPAEVVYWLQLKDVFDHYQTPFPVIMPRNFAMVIDRPVLRKLEKTGLDAGVFFEEKNFLFNHWVLQNTRHNLTVGSERSTLMTIYEDLKARAEGIDATLGPFVGAEGKRVLNSLEKIEKKMLRAEKRLHQDRLRQIEEVKDALFPNGSLQERTDNFLNFYNQDNAFIQKLITHFDPFDFQFNILTYHD